MFSDALLHKHVGCLIESVVRMDSITSRSTLRACAASALWIIEGMIIAIITCVHSVLMPREAAKSY
jgi:hypothetical protein